MKITGFEPIIDTNNAENIISLFNALGFEKIHSPVTELETGKVTNTIMKDQNGFRVDVTASSLDLEADKTFIRMNVDNFEEAYKILTDYGFKNTRGDNTLDLSHASAATMVAPTGLIIVIVKHIK